MAQLHTHQAWDISRPDPVCGCCRAALLPGQSIHAILVETRFIAADRNCNDKTKAPPPPFTRIDFCDTCWNAGKRPQQALFSFWRTAMAMPNQKKKLLVDDAVLIELFTRLAERPEARDVCFRFVLGLILMRKRLLRYDRTEKSPTTETWIMLPRGSNIAISMINPQLTEEQIGEVSQQLSSILAEEI